MRLPGDVGVGEQHRERLARRRASRRRPRDPSTSTERGAPLRRVEIVGERRRRSPEWVELAPSRSPPAASSNSARRTAAFSSSSSTTTAAGEEAGVHCSAGSHAQRPDPVADRLPRHASRSSRLRDSASQQAGVPASWKPATKRPLASIRKSGLVGRAEAPCERALRVAERRPGPAVAAHRTPVRRLGVSRVQAEEVGRVLFPDPPCVGDRLAVAGASPRRPDVDHHRLASQVGERNRSLGDPGDGGLLRGGRGGGRGRHDQEDEAATRAARDPFARHAR